MRRVIVLLSAVPLALLGAGSASASTPDHGGGGGSKITITDFGLSGNNPSGDSALSGDVEISAAAPSGGVVVTLASSSPSVLSVPASFSIASGLSGSFEYSTGIVSAPTSVTVTATLGSSSASETVTVTPTVLQSVEPDPGEVVGGSTDTVLPELNGPAPPGGVTVSLTSSNPSLAPVPATALIPAGSTSTPVSVTTGVVTATTTVTFTASWNGTTISGQLQLDPPPPPPPPVTPTSVTFSPATVYGTGGSTGTVELSGPSPAGGTTVTLQIENDGFALEAAAVPASVTVPAGASSATFPVTTTPPADSDTPVTISAGIGSTTYASGTLAVIAPGLQSVTVSSGSVAGGATATGTATLNVAAPAGGALVSLISSNTAAATVPASVTVPAGAASATFAVTTLSQKSTTTVAVGGIWAGASRAALLGVTGGRKGGSVLTEPSADADFPEPFTFDTTPVGDQTEANPHPFEITLTSLGSFTASIESGSLPPGFTLETVTSMIAGIGGVPTTQGLYAFVLEFTLPSGTVFGWPYVWQIIPPAPPPPPPPLSLTLSPSTVQGGSSSTGTVSLTAAAPAGGTSVSLSSANTVGSVPASVVIPAGQTSATFQVTTTQPVSSEIVFAIEATADGTTALAPLTVTQA